MKIVIVSILFLYLLVPNVFSQDPSDTDQNPYRSPAAGADQTGPVFKFDWTAEKYLEAVELVEKQYSKESPYSNSAAEKLKTLLGLKVYYLTEAAPRPDFSHQNIAHLNQTGNASDQVLQQIKTAAIDARSGVWKKQNMLLLNLLLELDDNKKLPKLTETAIETVFLGMPPGFLETIYNKFVNTKWRPLANKAVVEFSTAAAYAFETRARKLETSVHVIGGVMLFTQIATIAASILIGAMFSQSYDDLYFIPGTAIAVVVEFIAFTALLERIQKKGDRALRNVSFYNNILKTALEEARRSGYPWQKGIGIPNIVHLQACDL